MQFHAIPCNTMQYYAIQCNTMQYHAIPCIINNCWRSVPLPCGQYMAIFWTYMAGCMTKGCITMCTMHYASWRRGGGILLQLQARVAQSISINSPCELLIAIIHNASEAHWLRQGISWNSQICWPRRANSNDVENCGLLLSYLFGSKIHKPKL